MGSRGDDRALSRARCKRARSGGEEGATSKPFSAEQVRFFETEVQPILKARCLKCHGGGPKVKANFRVDSREGLLRGGDLGPAVSLESAGEKPAAAGDPLRRAGDAARRQAARDRDRDPDAVGQSSGTVECGRYERKLAETDRSRHGCRDR